MATTELRAELRAAWDDPAYRERQKELGRRGYANRLVVTGEIERAKEYCVLHNLGWPPFPAKGLPAMAVPPPATTDPVEAEKLRLLQSKAAIEKKLANPNRFNAGGRAKKKENRGKYRGRKVPLKIDEVNARLAELGAGAAPATPPMPAAPPVAHSVTIDPTPTITFSVDASREAVAVADAVQSLTIVSPPTLANGSAIREAEIMFACINPRLFAIRFLDGGNDEASLYREPGRKVGTVVKVRCVDGVGGANPIYEEVLS